MAELIFETEGDLDRALLRIEHLPDFEAEDLLELELLAKAMLVIGFMSNEEVQAVLAKAAKNKKFPKECEQGRFDVNSFRIMIEVASKAVSDALEDEFARQCLLGLRVQMFVEMFGGAVVWETIDHKGDINVMEDLEEVVEWFEDGIASDEISREVGETAILRTKEFEGVRGPSRMYPAGNGQLIFFESTVGPKRYIVFFRDRYGEGDFYTASRLLEDHLVVAHRELTLGRGEWQIISAILDEACEKFFPRREHDKHCRVELLWGYHYDVILRDGFPYSRQLISPHGHQLSDKYTDWPKDLPIDAANDASGHFVMSNVPQSSPSSSENSCDHEYEDDEDDDKLSDEPQGQGLNDKDGSPFEQELVIDAIENPAEDTDGEEE